MWTSLAEFGSGILIKVGIGVGIALLAILAMMHHDNIIRKEALINYNNTQLQEVARENAESLIKWQELHKIFNALSAEQDAKQNKIIEESKQIEIHVLINKDNDPNAPSSKILKDTVRRLEGLK